MRTARIMTMTIISRRVSSLIENSTQLRDTRDTTTLITRSVGPSRRSNSERCVRVLRQRTKPACCDNLNITRFHERQSRRSDSELGVHVPRQRGNLYVATVPHQKFLVIPTRRSDRELSCHMPRTTVLRQFNSKGSHESQVHAGKHFWWTVKGSPLKLSFHQCSCRPC